MQPINRLFVMVRITIESFIFERLGHGGFGSNETQSKTADQENCFIKEGRG